MGPKAKFWIKCALGNCAIFAGYLLAARMGLSGIGALMVGAAAGTSVMIVLWPNNILGEVVSDSERNSSWVWSFLVAGLCFVFVLLMSWAFVHLQAKREARKLQEPSGLSLDLNRPSDRAR